MIGYGMPPPEVDVPLSIIDFHGKMDDDIPYDEEGSFGLGPEGSLISYDGLYYDDKATLLAQWGEKLGCSANVSSFF
jgi:hypothetical protein